MLSRFPDSPEFGRLVAGANDVHLARIALEIARDAHPELDIECYLEKIQQLAERTRDRCRPGSKIRDILGQMNWVLFVEAGLRANEEDYYDPRNSYLNEVLDRGLGIPISLSLVYWAVGERLGVRGGANLPLHFMLRFEEDGRTWFVDPFRGGAIYNRENCARKLSDIVQQPVVLTDSLASPCAIRVVVARMLRNLKVVYGRRHEIASLLPVHAGWPPSARTILRSCEISACCTPKAITWARPSTRLRPISKPHRWLTTSRKFVPCSKRFATRSPSGTEN